MGKYFRFAWVMVLVLGCIEPYNFRITDEEPGIVIEATLTDRSYRETKSYPSDGVYFTVKISRTSDVINVRSLMVSYAYVMLTSDEGESWEVLEQDAVNAPGIYKLMDDDFKAKSGVRYKLSVTTPDNVKIESDWQQMPSNAPAMGPVSFRETVTQRVILDEVRDIRGVQTQTAVPSNETGATTYYRWKFLPTWLFDAPLVASGSPVKQCWATTRYYIRGYQVLADQEGGYDKDLFFLEIESNERILQEMSVLIQQQAMTEEYYYFWKEMQDLNQADGVFATPPFNLKSNFTASSGNVFGYFGVVREQGVRWYFNPNDLSYSFPNWLPEQCNTPCGPGCPPPECSNCLRYEGGEDITNVKPEWWGR